MNEASTFAANALLRSVRRTLRGLPTASVDHVSGDSALADNPRLGSLLKVTRAASSAFADSPVSDAGPLSSMQRKGFWQNADLTLLRLAPVVAFPCMVFAPWVMTPTEPLPDRRLWLRVTYDLAPATWEQMEPLPFDPEVGRVEYQKETYTGWNNTILKTQLSHAWLEPETVPANQIFPDLQRYSLPPNNQFIWHWLLGSTDGQGLYTPFPGVHSTVLNPFS